MDISVVIPLYNAWRLTRGCLESLYESLRIDGTGGAPSVEVILVDNGSFDETPRAVEELRYPNLHYHRMPKNLGFAKASNFGARKAAGDLLLFLNNDTVVLPGS